MILVQREVNKSWLKTHRLEMMVQSKIKVVLLLPSRASGRRGGEDCCLGHQNLPPPLLRRPRTPPRLLSPRPHALPSGGKSVKTLAAGEVERSRAFILRAGLQYMALPVVHFKMGCYVKGPETIKLSIIEYRELL